MILNFLCDFKRQTLTLKLKLTGGWKLQKNVFFCIFQLSLSFYFNIKVCLIKSHKKLRINLILNFKHFLKYFYLKNNSFPRGGAIFHLFAVIPQELLDGMPSERWQYIIYNLWITSLLMSGGIAQWVWLRLFILRPKGSSPSLGNFFFY